MSNNNRRMVAGDFQTTKAALVRAREYYKDPDFPTDDRAIGKGLRVGTRILWRRPKDLQKGAVFMEQGATRHDVDQGALGNCWFIAGAATLASTNKALFEKVVPPDQEFDDNYAGMFRFNFWWYGKWTEVVVDDYLPTDGYELVFCSNRERRNEFWPALLEKAYAKLRGSYAALDGGKLQDAMVDLTGGVSEVIDLREEGEVKANLYDLLMASYNMKSMVGACIFRPEGSKESEIEMTNGLYMGHAYSVTGFQQLKRQDGTYINLLRLRNPWGKGEWKGAWSDGSREMKSLPEEIKRIMEYQELEEGEFWIEYKDFLRNYHEIQLCHLQVDALTDQISNNTNKQAWNVTVYHDEWIRGVTAGGCGNSPNQKLYWSNPQFLVNLSKPDTIHSHNGDCTVIISLMEKEYRNTVDPNQDVAIGFDLYKLKSSDHRPLNGKRAPENALLLAKRGGKYQYYREVTKRFTVPPGDYVVIPSTFHPNQEAKFMLRIFTEKFAESGVMEDNNIPTRVGGDRLPSTSTNDFMQDLFDKHSGADSLLDASELQRFLEDVSAADIKQKLLFDMEQCRSMLPMANTSGTGRLQFKEAKQLWKEIKAYREVFIQFDKDRTNSIDTFELTDLFTKLGGPFRTLLREYSVPGLLGFPVSRSVLTAIVRRYGDRDNRISFQDFIVAFMRLVQLFNVYKEYEGKSGKTGTAQFTQNEFLQHTMYL